MTQDLPGSYTFLLARHESHTPEMSVQSSPLTFTGHLTPARFEDLGNMGVRCSMSIVGGFLMMFPRSQVRSTSSLQSIPLSGKLWGLVVCHSYGEEGMRVSFPVRQMLRLLSDSIARNIERLVYARRLHTRKLVSQEPYFCDISHFQAKSLSNPR